MYGRSSVYVKDKTCSPFNSRACLHGGGGPQIGEVTCAGHPTFLVDVSKLIWVIIWTGGLPHQSGLPHLPGAPHVHVIRLLLLVFHTLHLLHLRIYLLRAFTRKNYATVEINQNTTDSKMGRKKCKL